MKKSPLKIFFQNAAKDISKKRRIESPEHSGNLTLHFNQSNHDIKFFSCNHHKSGHRWILTPFWKRYITITKRRVAELIQYIEVYPEVKEDGITNQRIAIHYNCIGAFEVPNRRKIPEQDILLETRKGVALSYASAQSSI